MSIEITKTFAAALASAANTIVYYHVAPESTPTSYVVYTLAGNTGPRLDMYGESYIEDNVYLVSTVAASRLVAEQLSQDIGDTLHQSHPIPTITIRRENRVSDPNPMPDQKRYVVQTYYRCIYTRGD